MSTFDPSYKFDIAVTEPGGKKTTSNSDEFTLSRYKDNDISKRVLINIATLIKAYSTNQVSEFVCMEIKRLFYLCARNNNICLDNDLFDESIINRVEMLICKIITSKTENDAKAIGYVIYHLMLSLAEPYYKGNFINDNAFFAIKDFLYTFIKLYGGFVDTSKYTIQASL